MELKIFNKANSSQGPKGKKLDPLLRVKRAGRIDIGEQLQYHLGGGDFKIMFAQDEKEPSDWFLVVAVPQSKDAFELKRSEKQGKVLLTIFNKQVAGMLLDSSGVEGDSAAFLIGSEKKDLPKIGITWPIITSSWKMYQRKRSSKAE